MAVWKNPTFHGSIPILLRRQGSYDDFYMLLVAMGFQPTTKRLEDIHIRQRLENSDSVLLFGKKQFKLFLFHHDSKNFKTRVDFIFCFALHFNSLF
jgi:hypothetical protein